jgi:hypothetical protein
MTHLVRALKRVFLCRHKMIILDVSYDGCNLAERCICKKCGHVQVFKTNINSLC